MNNARENSDMTVRRHRRTYKPSWNCAKEKQLDFLCGK